MATDNTVLSAAIGVGDSIRDINRAGVKTQVAQLDMGGAAGEVLVVAGQQLKAASLPVVLASDQGAIAVTTDGLTDTQLRASAVPVSMAATPALTDTQLRASAVPVSAAALPLPAGASTETTLAAISTKTPSLGFAAAAASSPVTVSGETASGTITTQNLVPTGVATAGSAIEISPKGGSTLVVQVQGVYTGTLGLAITTDGVLWSVINHVNTFLKLDSQLYGATVASATIAHYKVELAPGILKARIYATAAVTGTATINLGCAIGATMVALSNALPAGAAAIGSVTIGSGTVTTVSTVTSVTAVAASTPVTPTTTLLNSAATTNANFSKASAGTVWSLVCSNMTASPKFVKLFNKASAPTVGTDLAAYVMAVPANSQAQMDGGSNGLRFATGIAYCITGAQPDSDATAVALGDVKMALTWT